MRPEALLLDEPTAGLDEETDERVSGILVRLPLAMVVVSHGRALLREVTHRTYRLAERRLGPCDGPSSAAKMARRSRTTA